MAVLIASIHTKVLSFFKKNSAMSEKDTIFLECINSVYNNFSFFKNNGNISAYTYKGNQIENIPTDSGGGGVAYFVHVGGAYIIVDYSMIKPEMFESMISGLDKSNPEFAKKQREIYKSGESRVGRYAACVVFAILASRCNLVGYDKEVQTFDARGNAVINA